MLNECIGDAGQGTRVMFGIIHGYGNGPLTFPGTANDLGAQANGAIVLTVGIDAHLGRKDAGLQHVLHLAVGVYIARKYLQSKKKKKKRY